MSGKSAVQSDWEEREYLEGLVSNVKKVTDFLNKFGAFASRFCFVRVLIGGECRVKHET